jgi:CTP:molybdopterin cytidylyltransferase MocA
MGRPKLELPLGGRSVLEWVIVALREGGVDAVLVVVGPQVPQLVPLARSAGADALLLDHETPAMRATVLEGLRWLEERHRPGPEDRWLLVPADHPTLDAGVVRGLLQAPATASIVIPTHEGHRGHPTRIAWRHVPAIRQLPPDQGLNAYLRQHPGDTLEWPVATAAILQDLDTPADLERLRQRFPG